MSASRRPVVLLTNDDGPPCASSPNIYGFCKLLQDRLGWDVRVVIPDSQKSWVGKAYAISEIITATYFYPRGPDGLEGETSHVRRPLKEGELMEWVLLSGTPATCANIGLHNLYPGEIDFVISGPNHGRNSSTAFALSSGTIGAALAAVMSRAGPSAESERSHIPCLAISYGVVKRPVPSGLFDLAHEAAVDVADRLWADWGHELDGQGRKRPVALYTVNVPLTEAALDPQGRKTCWADFWQNDYGRLFKPAEEVAGQPVDQSGSTSSSSTAPAGPNAMPTPAQTPGGTDSSSSHSNAKPLRFQFAPDLRPVLNPKLEELPEGSDAWAFEKGYISVVPMRAEHSVVGREAGQHVSQDGTPRRAGQIWDRAAPSSNL